MSQETVDLTRAGYVRAARRDFSVRVEDFADDHEFVTSPELPDAGIYRGEAAMRWQVVTFRDAKIARTQPFPERGRAPEAAGMSE